MVTSIKNNAYATAARFAAIAYVVCGFPLALVAETEEYLPPESGMRQHPVALEQFVQLRAGMKRADVETLLAKHGEHQFTYKNEQGEVWTCFQYAVAQQPRYASSAYNLLYKEGLLHAIMDSMDDWNHRKELGPKLDEISDPVKRTERYIQETLRIKAVRGKEIADKMQELKKYIIDEEKEHKARDERNPPDPGLTFVITAFRLLTPFQQAELKRAYKTNAEYLAKFDGGKVNIGMTEAQVENAFGKPLANEKLSNSEHVAIYGPSDIKAIEGVQAYLACGPVAVLFHDGAAMRVMSNWYCDVDWRDKVWPELKSAQRGSKK
jgi:hypothetical protein